MVDKPTSLARTRAERGGDARLWSPRDALQAAIDDLDAGKIKPDHVYIAFRIASETADPMDVVYLVDAYSAGMVSADAVALLAIHKAAILAKMIGASNG